MMVLCFKTKHILPSIEAGWGLFWGFKQVLSCLQRLSVVSGWQSLLALPQGFQRSKQVRACQHILAAGSRSLVRVVIKSCHDFGRQEKTISSVNSLLLFFERATHNRLAPMHPRKLSVLFKVVKLKDTLKNNKGKQHFLINAETS
ncbi:hypothetical protein POPTR_002G169350v4 [Populus trichocarpa]|uniref:Uncharacterized protein n=2 Tax=Populus trichocarpa TaxID=3694 RepID=A0ACC0TFJ2_POPTR|nr:hypothetical protein POPTR_002G169350v4 [Populus trichocarpa]KAI9399939.1 hypothetical protein POPTR_002G169350v4 [Populus trichocarpa]